ncbi:microcin C transport system substrate-binding protein [Loktanella sp. DSM 29012]|uniref:extracellular solute-binding protein n=1 Tax=Loktanella sp. DSM 29012 TaxID=1881056 RepID=UPI0008C06FEB|nr:extracellular solute-binding protein [Loktanella sp. DSM 29012]SEQ02176.1 microcin C transport system substrate-binding protein [Loktanella sp. DSM 29012]
MPQAICRPRIVNRTRHALLGSTLLFGAALWADQAVAQDEALIETHAYSYFGDVKYGPDMTHLDYVNPDAPKGGEMSQSVLGTFDSFNLFTRLGNAAALSTTPFEDIMIATADDPTTLYCYLCTTIEYPEDLSYVIINLREDVTFSDGSPMTAADMEFTYNLFMEQGLPEFLAVVNDQISDFEVLDTYRFKYTFTDQAPLRARVGLASIFSPFSKAEWEASDRRLDESWDTPPMGTGAYMLGSFDYGRDLTYVRNPNFWGADLPLNVGRNNFDSIRLEYFADGSAALEGFKAGIYRFRNEFSSLQWATAYDFPAVQDGAVIKTELPDGNLASAQSFIFNLRREKFQDPRVREALGLMFNFEWSNETLFYGLYDRVTGFWSNSELAATGTPSEGELALLQPLVDEGLFDASILTDEVVMPPVSTSNQLDRGNLRRASALLDEAGWIAGDDGMRRKEGEVLRVEFLESSPSWDRIINPYVQNLTRLGIDAVLDRVDPAQETERRRSGDWDMLTHSIQMGLEPGQVLYQWFGSETAEDSSRNLMYLKNEGIDRLIDAVVNATTTEEMTTATHALDRALRTIRFNVPQWFKAVHTVAYYDIYDHPAELPPYALGEIDFWWYDADRAAELGITAGGDTQ